ncbi:ABC transporter permease [Microbacterium sp. RD1]|uniref:ABC transporter permease n=1 Tax=Microbacterium sp. RD1 TaxID=3457313 RepID=UPI003FA54D16
MNTADRVAVRLPRWARSLPLVQIGVVVAAWVATLVLIPGIGRVTGVYSLLILAAFLGIAAAGQTLVVLIGGIDLSVPAVIGASNLLCALWLGQGWPFWVVVAVIAVLSAGVGAANGYLSERFQLPPLVVTIAVGSIAIGLALVATGGGNVIGSLPDWLARFSSPLGTVGPIPLPPVLLLWALLIGGITVVLVWTRTGLRLYATGASARAARLARVPVRAVWVGTFVASACSSALLGIVLLGFGGAGQPDVGDPYLFTSLAAVLVGGTSLLGGRGDYLRTVLGALIIQLLSILLVGFGLGAAAQQMVTGVIIFAAVAVYGRESRVRDRV